MAGDALLRLREDPTSGRRGVWALRDRGDQLGHDLLTEALARHRPADVVLSEEGTEDLRRLGADRTWIVDPLDGTHDYPFAESIEWAVHVALVEDGAATAAAVAVPGLGAVYGTDDVALADAAARPEPLVVCGRSNLYLGSEVADELGGRVTACGSSGVKAMLAVRGSVDVYVHGSGLWEWDVCAPAAVAEAAGLVVTDLEGEPIVYNKVRPIVAGLVISRPEFADRTRAVLDSLL